MSLLSDRVQINNMNFEEEKERNFVSISPSLSSDYSKSPISRNSDKSLHLYEEVKSELYNPESIKGEDSLTSHSLPQNWYSNKFPVDENLSEYSTKLPTTKTVNQGLMDGLPSSEVLSSPGLRRFRTMFTPAQLEELEKQFNHDQYLNKSIRKQFAEKLNLTERQIKVWFQNRRMKLKQKKKVKISPYEKMPTSTQVNSEKSLDKTDEEIPVPEKPLFPLSSTSYNTGYYYSPISAADKYITPEPTNLSYFNSYINPSSYYQMRNNSLNINPFQDFYNMQSYYNEMYPYGSFCVNGSDGNFNNFDYLNGPHHFRTNLQPFMDFPWIGQQNNEEPVKNP